MNNLQSFIRTVSYRVNHVWKIALNKVSAKLVRCLVSQIVQQSIKLVRKPSLKPRDKIWTAMEDLLFRKGHKQRFTDEVFQNTKNSTFTHWLVCWLNLEEHKSMGRFTSQSWQKLGEMVDFDIFLVSPVSTWTYRQNTVACFRDLLTKSLQPEGGWRVALPDVISPSRTLALKSTSSTHRKLLSVTYHQLAIRAQEA